MTRDDCAEVLALAEADLARAVERFLQVFGETGARVVVPQIVAAEIGNAANRKRVAETRREVRP